MNIYLADQAVTQAVVLADEAGTPIDATAASYRVLNESGAIVVASTVINPWVAGTDEVSITVSAPNNALPEGKTRAMRTIELTLTTVDGTRLVTSEYMIEAIEPLSVPTNSFQTYAQALLLSMDIPNLSAWTTATRTQRISALMQARINLASMQYSYSPPDNQIYLTEEFYIENMNDLDLTAFNELPEEFLNALLRAQVIEADDALGGNPYEDKRRRGLMSETIGESSNMFRPGTPLKMPVCERAMRELSRYVIRTIRIGRA